MQLAARQSHGFTKKGITSVKLYSHCADRHTYLLALSVAVSRNAVRIDPFNALRMKGHLTLGFCINAFTLVPQCLHGRHKAFQSRPHRANPMSRLHEKHERNNDMRSTTCRNSKQGLTKQPQPHCKQLQTLRVQGDHKETTLIRNLCIPKA